MESTRAGLLRAVLTCGLMVGLALGPAAAHGPTPVKPRDVRVADLPRDGSAARVPWLADNVVHTARGGTVRLPWTERGARARHLSLVGPSGRGWLVKDVTGNVQSLWLARAGHRQRLFSGGVSEGESFDFRASGDSRRFLVRSFDGDRHTSLSVHGLRGRLLAARDYEGLPTVLAFPGPRVIVGSSPAQVWTVDGDTVRDLGVDAVGADPAHDVIFAASGSGRAGPTRLSAPAAPPWSASMAQPVVSPGGGRVLSRDRDGGHVLTVRNLTSGRVRASFAVRFVAAEAPRWESDRAFVFVGSVGGLGDREALVRCTVSLAGAGRCARVSGIRPRDVISTPR